MNIHHRFVALIILEMVKVAILGLAPAIAIGLVVEEWTVGLFLIWAATWGVLMVVYARLRERGVAE